MAGSVAEEAHPHAAFHAPEGQQDDKADLYSAGVVLWCMLQHQLAPPTKERIELHYVPGPGGPDGSPTLHDLVGRLLGGNPAMRPDATAAMAILGSKQTRKEALDSARLLAPPRPSGGAPPPPPPPGPPPPEDSPFALSLMRAVSSAVSPRRARRKKQVVTPRAPRVNHGHAAIPVAHAISHASL